MAACCSDLIYTRGVERRAPRYTLWLPVQVQELSEGMAVGHDASALGLSMVTASRLEIGAPVTLTLRIPPESENERTVRGHVVRVERNDDDPDSIWPHRIAVEFEEADAEVGRALVSLEEQGLAKKRR